MRATGRTRREVDELLAMGLPHEQVGQGRGGETRISVDKALAWFAARVLDGADANPVKERLDQLRAEKLQLELDEKRGILVDRAEVNNLFYAAGKGLREAWEQWPPMVAAEMAAELGVGQYKMLTELERRVRENLARTKQDLALRLRRDEAA